MKKIAIASALFLLTPPVSFAAPLTQAQAESLINVVRSSPGTPANAFTSLITAFSNITIAQAESLIGVVQASPNSPAGAFVSLLTSFTVDTTTTSPASSTSVPAVATTPVSNETLSQKNAVKAAQSYLNTSAFSQDGLVSQLEYDQFTQADATYGADNSGADWNQEAVKAAKQYLANQAFSYNGLITQLEYDKFTQAQAEYGVNATGL